ncbi:hypothetical protein Gotur_035267 [Gossypium turneri]
MKVSKLTAMNVGNCFQLHASLVFIATITFTSNVQRHPLKFLITLFIPQIQVFFFDKGHTLMMTWYMVVHYARKNVTFFFFECNACYFSLDIKCAQLSYLFKFSQPSKHNIHKHTLTFIENPMTIKVLKRFNCFRC